MKNIMIVDDDVSIRRMLGDYLSQHAFRISAVENRAQMNRQMAIEAPDLVIVDMNLGQEDGLEIVRNLSSSRNVPIIIISGARLDEEDKVTGLEVGARDYITKPFSMREFLARVRAALREQPDKRIHSSKIYTFDGWRVSTRNRQLRRTSGEEVKLTSTEFNLLVAFLEAPRQILSREQLLLATRVHDQEIYDRSVDVLILRLRRKLEIDASTPSYIKTERGIGYMFNAEVHSETLRVRTQ
ncbi:two-component system response regulator [Ensifer sp. Root31]|uniref:response regulator n=1 Tax=Ensifer sp. Root31 TaxID=1736512 RepID=UPI00070B17CF|nr:response regulator [Ensifer sp. Root31]KQU85457.1 two-component system response regulator [Ensifer sp. Root31]